MRRSVVAIAEWQASNNGAYAQFLASMPTNWGNRKVGIYYNFNSPASCQFSQFSNGNWHSSKFVFRVEINVNAGQLDWHCFRRLPPATCHMLRAACHTDQYQLKSNVRQNSIEAVTWGVLMSVSMQIIKQLIRRQECTMYIEEGERENENIYGGVTSDQGTINT